ncbi:site-specific integrase [Carboxylicivirga marina]|uniref:site-specific integrase n=1 Tax=Carboxylicivirga marina TaxID=2800988 RepID=UPI0025922380|nr:site-specific integrase [uncultured Carboxylicivirga sp.]
MKYNTNNFVKYNLKKHSDTSKPFQIILIIVHKGQRMRYYTGKRIKESNWNTNKQRAKNTYATASTLNSFLDTLANFVEDEYNKMKMSGEIINTTKIKELIEEFQHRVPTDGILKHYDEFIEHSRNYKTQSTIECYKSNKSRLKGFYEKTKHPMSYNLIDKHFHEKYINYLLTEKKLSNSTISRDTKYIKTFLSWATDKGYNKNIAYQKFKFKSNEGQIFFLSWDELIQLFNHDLDNNERLKRTRDIFCFGCFTGMRFSDIINLKHENVEDDYINFITIKTNDHCSIPFNKYSKEIYERYKAKEGLVFPSITNQKMNESIKDVGEVAEINAPVQVISYKGANRIEKTVPKYKILTSHIARKTFITNALEKGMKSEVIMDITTHKSYNSFKRYFKVVDEHKKNEMDKIFD